MRRFLFLPLATLMLMSLVAGCDAVGTDDGETSGGVQLSGQVLNSTTNNPVPDAVVRIAPYDLIFEVDDEGKFSASIDVDSTMDLQVTATSSGFSNAGVTVLAMAGRTVTVPTLRLTPTTDAPPESGQASNILLLNPPQQSIGVKESGSQEVADLTFQVTDSVGRPVILDHAVDVSFSLGVSPRGGEFLSPSSARTDNNGEVSVHLSSGTKAGVVQVVAQATVGGRTIRSIPVSVTIHGGLPDANHFTLAPAAFNFPGLTTYGVTDAMSIIVGDRFGNPVKPGTAVYFTTSHGVIGGSTLTDEAGGGGVTLTSANPLPPDGVATVTAKTADADQDSIITRIPVLFTGRPVVDFLDNFPAGPYARMDTVYRVSITDPLGNPLIGGTTITVEAEGTAVKAVGNVEAKLDDTAFRPGSYDDGKYDSNDVVKGQGITEFSFWVSREQENEEDIPELKGITLTVSGANGTLQIALSPVGVAGSAGKNGAVVVKKLASGATRVQAAE
ncbi:MAG TPA: Ig-like domain-containing protein [Rhodothermales bacterium]|nr:Ig-like domain-containing protein [Rhodothermales bacterium]